MSEVERISVGEAPAPKGAYSQVVRAGDLLFVSGQGPIDPVTQELALSDIRGETQLTLENVERILTGLWRRPDTHRSMRRLSRERRGFCRDERGLRRILRRTSAGSHHGAGWDGGTWYESGDRLHRVFARAVADESGCYVIARSTAARVLSMSASECAVDRYQRPWGRVRIPSSSNANAKSLYFCLSASSRSR